MKMERKDDMFEPYDDWREQGMEDYPEDLEVEDAANGHGQEVMMEEVLGKSKETTMHNIKLTSRPHSGILASALNIGEFARIIVIASTADNVGDIVLKTSIGVVNVTKPSVLYPSFSTPKVERLNTGDKLEITVGFTTDFEKRIFDIAKNNNKIWAIKEVREATNWGLKESKEYVDALLLKF